VIIWQTISQSYESLFKGLIGFFGWLDYTLSWIVYIIFSIYFSIVIYKVKNKLPKLEGAQFIILLAITFGTIMAIFLAMYLYATPVSSSFVQGIQGRYFLLLLPYIIWIGCSLWRQYKHKLLIFIALVILASITNSVWNRYFNYSNHYYRQAVKMTPIQDNIPVLVDENYQQVISVDKTKKIRGLTFFSLQNSMRVTVPHEFSIYDKSCQYILSKTILDASTIQYSNFTNLVTPILSPKEDAICIKIKPYHSIIFPEDGLLLATDEQGNTLWPLIIY